EEEDFDTVLSVIATDIHKREVRLSEIRLRERRLALVVTMYAAAAWFAYVSMWYVGVVPSITGKSKYTSFERAVSGFPVAVGPIVILFLRRIVQLFYARKGDAEESALQARLKEQRAKVEEIKKKTNYYSTRDLLQKYDDTPSVLQTPQRASAPRTPQPQPNGISRPSTAIPVTAALKQQLTSSPAPFVQGPPRKKWYDKLADAILGDDDGTAVPGASRYALICEKCFAHNGLVKEDMWEDAQYICPKCHHFNPSARSKKQASQMGVPISSISPITPSQSVSSAPFIRRPSPSGPSRTPSREPKRAPLPEALDTSSTTDSVDSVMQVDGAEQ
ncbi:hypothetical protein FISHEDRAFT_43606, partial [Fistulina hepatica ATCC 64428]